MPEISLRDTSEATSLLISQAGGIMWQQCEIHEGIGLESQRIGDDDEKSSTNWTAWLRVIAEYL